MILEQLSLANFRGFEQIDLTFDPRVTVVAGVNGVGKSGILHALAVLFARALPKFTPAHKLRISLPGFVDDEIQHGRSSLTASLVVQTSNVSLESIGILRRVDDALLAELDFKQKAIRQEIR